MHCYVIPEGIFAVNESDLKNKKRRNDRILKIAINNENIGMISRKHSKRKQNRPAGILLKHHYIKHSSYII